MSRKRSVLLLIFLIIAASVVLSGCSNAAESTKTNPAAANAEPAAAGKIPITTSSEEARKEFLQGRDLSEKLLLQDSIQHFDKAISLDPNFAWARIEPGAGKSDGQGILRSPEEGGESRRQIFQR